MMLLAPPVHPVTIAVDGEGMLRFARGGALVYARRATLHVANGVLVDAAGLPLAPRVPVARAFSVTLDGTILSAGAPVGRIVLARLAAGRASLMNPGEGPAGVIRTSTSAPTMTTNSPVRTTSRVFTTPSTNLAPPKTGAPKSGSINTGAITITIRPDSRLDGERILLGQIAEIVAPAPWRQRLTTLDLGLLPPLGSTRQIGPMFVRSLVRGLGLKAGMFELTVPPGSIAARSGVVIETQTILDEALKDNEGFVAKPVPSLTVPPGTLQLTTTAGARNGAARTVLVTAMVDGKIAGSRTVLLSPDPNVPTMKIGDVVKLRIIAGSATIELPAKAKTAARQGDPITVVTETGSVHTGKLLPNGLVEVRL